MYPKHLQIYGTPAYCDLINYLPIEGPVHEVLKIYRLTPVLKQVWAKKKLPIHDGGDPHIFRRAMDKVGIKTC
jgi:hypothetical protein